MTLKVFYKNVDSGRTFSPLDYNFGGYLKPSVFQPVASGVLVHPRSMPEFTVTENTVEWLPAYRALGCYRRRTLEEAAADYAVALRNRRRSFVADDGTLYLFNWYFGESNTAAVTEGKYVHSDGYFAISSEGELHQFAVGSDGAITRTVIDLGAPVGTVGSSMGRNDDCCLASSGENLYFLDSGTVEYTVNLPRTAKYIVGVDGLAGSDGTQESTEYIVVFTDGRACIIDKNVLRGGVPYPLYIEELNSIAISNSVAEAYPVYDGQQYAYGYGLFWNFIVRYTDGNVAIMAYSPGNGNPSFIRTGGFITKYGKWDRIFYDTTVRVGNFYLVRQL